MGKEENIKENENEVEKEGWRGISKFGGERKRGGERERKKWRYGEKKRWGSSSPNCADYITSAVEEPITQTPTALCRGGGLGEALYRRAVLPPSEPTIKAVPRSTRQGT